jgi:four helix bundle protein
MATIHRYEDLLVWKKARELVGEIYKEMRKNNDNGFKDQIQRASVSVMSNVAEGFERGTKNEFVNYLQIAKGSAGEVRAQLYIASDIGYLNIEKFIYLKNLSEEVSRLLFSLIKKIKTSEYSGTQYKKEKTKKQIELEKMDLEHTRILAESMPNLYKEKYEDLKNRIKN